MIRLKIQRHTHKKYKLNWIFVRMQNLEQNLNNFFFTENKNKKKIDAIFFFSYGKSSYSLSAKHRQTKEKNNTQKNDNIELK